MAFAAASDREARIYAAIAANLWSTYLKSAMTGSPFRNEADGDDLRILILPCEEGVVAVAAPSTMLLCLVGDSTIELGLLKAKVSRLRSFPSSTSVLTNFLEFQVEAVSKHLQEPLERVASYQQ